MILVEHEQLLQNFKKASLTLTSKRIRYSKDQAGQSKIISMTLDSISSCGLVTKSSPSLILLSIVAIVGAIVIKVELYQVILYVTALLLFISYFVTRNAVIFIHSNGGDKIDVSTNGLGKNSIIDIIDTIEKAKLQNHML